MILRALEFWKDRLFEYYLKITRINNPLFPFHDSGQHTLMDLETLNKTIENVKKNIPNTFLFSHRYIVDLSTYRYTDSIKIQKKLLQQKYPHLLHSPIKFQQGSIEPYMLWDTYGGIAFTVFFNEHPYIQRRKIVEVGKTNKGNIFVIKDNCINGA